MESLDTIIQYANLAQYPFLIAFAWWVWQMQRRQDSERERQDERWDANNQQWRDYLSARNSKLEKALEHLADAIKNKT